MSNDFGPKEFTALVAEAVTKHNCLTVTSTANTFDLSDADTDPVHAFARETTTAAGPCSMTSERGVQKAIASGAITAGAKWCPDGANPGQIKAAVTGDLAAGVVLQAGAANRVIKVLFHPEDQVL